MLGVVGRLQRNFLRRKSLCEASEVRLGMGAKVL